MFLILTLIQVAVVILVAAYLGHLRSVARRRSVQSWESLVGRLRPDWSARELSDHFLWKEGLSATSEETWERIRGAHGIWAMYENAGVILEMASYAALNCPSVDPELLAMVRSDAMQIRFCALLSLAQYGFSQASEGVRVNAYRTASMYTGMAARMTQLLQENAAGILPDFVAAM